MQAREAGVQDLTGRPGFVLDAARYAKVNEAPYRPYRNGPQRDPAPLFTYSAKLMLSFDYWVGKGVDLLTAMALHGTRRSNFTFYFQDLQHERWARAVLRLGDFRQVRDPAVRWQDGHPLLALTILARRQGKADFYADNVQLYRLREGSRNRGRRSP